MKTLDDWKTAYYEQQALHTEARGMLCDERDSWKAKYEEAARALSKEQRAPIIKLAAWMIDNAFATGHGDDLDALLHELTWQVAEIRDRSRQGMDCVGNLAAALRGVLDHYTALVNSGDAGNWNPEEERVVVLARAALAAAKEGK